MSELTDIEQVVTKSIIGIVGASLSSVKRESRLLDDLGLDELDKMQLAFDIEDELDMSLACRVEFDSCCTVGEVANLVKSIKEGN
jgi:acyl carrier protein